MARRVARRVLRAPRRLIDGRRMTVNEAPRPVAPAPPGPPVLSRRTRRTVTALAEVLFPTGRLDPETVSMRVDEQLRLMAGSKRMRSLTLVFAVVEYALPLAGIVALRGLPLPFSRLPAARRRRLVERVLARSRFAPLRTLAKLKVLLVAAYYSEPEVQAAIGFVPVEQRDLDTRPVDRGTVRLADPGDVLDVDVCVIGSGAGGALVAARAAAAGHAVALLEEGPYVPRDAVRHDERAMTAALYKEHGLQTTVDLGMTILQGRVLGGSTYVNNAICLRIGDADLRAPRRGDVLEDWRGLGAHVDPRVLRRSYERVEAELGVRRIDDAVVGASGHVLLDGWTAIDGRPGPGRARAGLFRKNVGGCVGCGWCNWACPYGHKLSVLETYVQAVSDAGGQVVCGCHATRLERAGSRVAAVRCRRDDGRELRVRARAVVVAAGAIGSSVLLLKSGFHRNVGSRFSFNVATPVFAAFDEPQHAWAGDQMTAYVDCGTFLLESHFDPPMSVAVALPGWNAEHMSRMDAYDRLTGLGVVVGTEASGRVKRWALLRDQFGPVKWSMTARDLATMRSGLGKAAEAYFAAGARTVYVAGFGDCALPAAAMVPNGRPDAEAIAAAIDRAVRGPGDLLLSSAHPQGGNPMSDDRRVGVVGSDFRVHGTDNLYVTDASVFPTSIHVNPQLTIMALADLAWERSLAARVA